MATMKELFLTAINNGMASAKMIQDPAHKANAYAALAHAMALTGLAGSADAPIESAPSVAKSGKDSLKPGADKKAETPTPAVAAGEQTVSSESEAPEAELTDEWTDEAVAAKADQITFIENLKAEYEESALDQCVQQFSEGQLQTLSEISPLNIDAFVAFMEAMINQAQ